MKQTFSKSERLRGKQHFDQLTKEGQSFFAYPFRVVWLPASETQEFPAQLAIAVPKRIFKRAVKRNLIRRRIREAFRKNKNILYDGLQQRNAQVRVLLIYTHREPVLYAEMEDKIILTLRRLLKAYDAAHTQRKKESGA
jgi:ribonuclease P protein component